MNREQLQTILWLRWRLTRNQWGRSGGLGARHRGDRRPGRHACWAGCVSWAPCSARPSAWPRRRLRSSWGSGWASPSAFLFFWMIGLLTELQRSESIDLQRLMHLPVALGQMFVVNYLASHFALSLIVAVPAMMGLAIGLAIARGPAMAAAGAPGVEHGLHDHGVDVLPARLAGDADEQPAPPPHGHHGHHLHVYSAQPGTEPLFQRPSATSDILGAAATARGTGRPPGRKCSASWSRRRTSSRRSGCPLARRSWPGDMCCPRCSARSAVSASARSACAARIAARCGFITVKPAGNPRRGSNRLPHPPPPRHRPEPAMDFWNCTCPPCRNRPRRWRWPPSVPCCARRR